MLLLEIPVMAMMLIKSVKLLPKLPNCEISGFNYKWTSTVNLISIGDILPGKLSPNFY